MLVLDDAPAVAQDEAAGELDVRRHLGAAARHELARRRVRRNQQGGEERDHLVRPFPMSRTVLFVMRRIIAQSRRRRQRPHTAVLSCPSCRLPTCGAFRGNGAPEFATSVTE